MGGRVAEESYNSEETDCIAKLLKVVRNVFRVKAWGRSAKLGWYSWRRCVYEVGLGIYV